MMLAVILHFPVRLKCQIWSMEHKNKITFMNNMSEFEIIAVYAYKL